MSGANYYHERTARQYTDVLMKPISFEEARELTHEICGFDFLAGLDEGAESEGVKMLIRLITGIAAYEDHEYRQMCALNAIQVAFSYSKTGEATLTNFVTEIYREAEGSASDEEKRV